ncbi:DUF3278 domain-containing protein [Apilactobacillus micheneri]|uniref:DUF3278 domain-containing protein n=1 Tax=Apilactobacillus micheneri TaxID=1899430 RepID=UPI000D02DEDD|nr:DUF3278 domain-containing protein [Apilactobacillus micheneri]TPR37743.1 DUF3278 domain-containing protein [Apilactobacillus micheneri]TPR39057.1 DUF3278 domain-containing protein [Apilactobacillus micheneri]
MNKQKESLYIKIIKHVYGIQGYFDEYKKQEVNRIGNNAFLILFSLFWIELLATSFASLRVDSDLILEILICSNLLIFFVILWYLAIAVSRLNLDQVEAYDDNDFHLKLKIAKKKAIFTFFLDFIIPRIFFFIFDLLDKDNELSIWQNIISPKENIVWGIGAIFMGFTTYLILKSRIKK